MYIVWSSSLGLDRQQHTSATKVRKYALERITPMAVYPSAYEGIFTLQEKVSLLRSGTLVMAS